MILSHDGEAIFMQEQTYHDAINPPRIYVEANVLEENIDH